MVEVIPLDLISQIGSRAQSDSAEGPVMIGGKRSAAQDVHNAI